MALPLIKITKYDSIEECMAAFFDEPVDEIPDGKWEWTNGGKIHIWPMRRVLRSRKKQGVWGWCEDKKRLHVWIADHAKPSRIVRLLAHELGHQQRPWHKTSHIEEFKAEIYADVAQAAFEIMAGIKGIEI